MIDLCHALQKQGIKATACHFTSNRYQFQPDICLNLERLSTEDREQRLSAFLDQAIKEYDIFHFHFGESFFPDKGIWSKLKKPAKNGYASPWF